MTTQEKSSPTRAPETGTFDAIIVGAGFAGLYQLHRLRGLGFSARVIEAGDGVGGTWYWNRYPGARCDVESLDYQYSFDDDLQREWNWTERYATQPEILKYVNHVAERFDLYRDITFETRVNSATWDDRTRRWIVGTDRGDRFTAQFLIAATGCLSTSRVPDYPGLDSFEGDWYHTGRWPHEGVDLSGKRVGVIGTGSSGVQSIPIMAQQAKELVVFQRTPNFSLPANNEKLTPDRVAYYKTNFAQIKAEARASAAGLSITPTEDSVMLASEDDRAARFEAGWGEGGFHLVQKYIDLLATVDANDIVSEFVRGKIREAVKDPEVAEMLSPHDHPLGTKRLCIDSGYYETYNRDNVELVNIRQSPIAEITPKGLKLEDGRDFEFDIIVFATGFDAMTGALLGMNIVGRNGEQLAEKWSAGPRTYLGLQSAGFPNLFMITGPGSPSVLSNMIVSIEQHVDWIAGCVEDLRERGATTIEATVAAEDAWVDHVNEVASVTLYPKANSWYLGANIPGKPRVFMPYIGGVGAYAERCREVAANGYEGFELAQEASVPA